ncbi:MAG: CHC2 zinc finger domain-containing protein [Burkholderiaceae bacterium]
MSFNRDALPEPVGYFEGVGLTLRGPGKWKTTRCEFHGGSDSMRVNTTSGAWVCMACGAKGGDVLSYEMQLTGAEFVEAAKALGAWIDDGREPASTKPTSLPPRAALGALAFEATLIAVAAGNVAQGLALDAADLSRVMVAAGRIQGIAGEYAA